MPPNTLLGPCRHLNTQDVSEPVQQELKQLAAALTAGDGAAAKRVQVGAVVPSPNIHVHSHVSRCSMAACASTGS
jgi:hypothetical protein